MRALLVLMVLVLSALPSRGQALDIGIRPDVVFVESLEADIVPVRRVFFHLVLHNMSADPLEIRWLRFDLVGSGGGVVSGQFSGPSLVALFDDSIARRRIEATETGSLVLAPDERKAVSDISLDLPSGLMGNTLFVESEFARGGAVDTSKVSLTLEDDGGFVGRLPFEGIWYVAAGHGALDPHRRFVPEGFAYDFLMVGHGGRSFEGTGGRNSDYLAYAQPVLAAAAGEVVYMRNDVPENVPGQAMPTVPGGNAIVLRHSDNVYTYYAHLRPGGMKVGMGERVEAGQPIAEVGNSGDSVEPHLHFHAMAGPDAGESPAIPARFENWVSQAYGRKAAVRRLGTIPRGEFVQQP